MRITRLYHPEPLQCDETTHLNKDTSSHLIRVLRTKTGTRVVLFNGDGFDYACRTLDDDVKSTALAVETKTATATESNLNICLIQGISRNDRMETSIQKSVELGVNKIIPVICQRSSTRLNKDKYKKKLTHWRKVAISACEQSGRSIIPEISEICELKNITSQLESAALKLNLDPKSRTGLKDIKKITDQNNIEFIIGPEGGLSDEEVDFLEENDFQSINFGARVLRTETAGPAVISALQILWGDLQGYSD